MQVCLLLNGTRLPRWQAAAVEYLLDVTDTTVVAVLYNDTERDRSVRETALRALELREWAIVGELNDRLTPDVQTERVHVEEILDRASLTERTVEPTVVDGWKQRIPAAVAHDLGERADVAIRFGFGFLTGPILTAFDHGVLSYHHGDYRSYRGQPMGFWEFLHDEAVAGITVQQLTDELDAGNVAAFREVAIDDLHTWEAIRRRLFAASEPLLASAIETIQTGAVQTPTERGELYTHPTGLSVLRFAVKNALGHLSGASD